MPNIEVDQGGIRDLIEELVDLIKALTQQLLSSKKPVRSTLELKPGEIKMPLTVTLGDPPGTATYQEFNAAGEPVPPLGVVHYASDDAAVATVDEATGVMSYVAAGSCNIAAADDGVSGGLPAQDSLTVLPAPTDMTPVSSTITLAAGVKTTKAAAGRVPKFVGGKFVK